MTVLRPASLALLVLAPLALSGVGHSGHLPQAAVVGADAVTLVYQFVPAVLIAAPGDLVTWQGFGGHTATFSLFVGAGPPPAGTTFDVGLTPQASWRVPDDMPPGVLLYRCRPHGNLGMQAAIVIV